MKLLSIGRGIAAAGIVFVAASGFTSQPGEAARTCVVSLVKYLKDACPAGLTYMASAHAHTTYAGDTPTITPTSDSGGACIKTLIKFHVKRCPA